MLTASQSTVGTYTTITSLSYIDSLVTTASNQGLYSIKLNDSTLTEDMIKDLIDNYGYKVTTQYYDMGNGPVYTILWDGTDIETYFPNYVFDYDFSNTNSYPKSGTTVTDLIGHSNATLSNSPTFSTQYGGILTFNGASSQSLINSTNLATYFSGTSPNKSTSFSIVLSIKPTGNGVILGETSITGWHYSVIEMVSGTIKFAGYDTGIRNFSSSIATPLNKWCSVIMTYDGTTMKGYINGQLAGSRSITMLKSYNLTPAKALYYQLGDADTTNNGDGTHGDFSLGRFEVLDGALSQTEIDKKYLYHVNRFGS